ncbi:MAG: SAM-dependent methyltransferase [Planctomycetaceae bacterium]|nr:SAM-dependent methyltransferase [Planctomycetaceae bacterium]
MNTNARSDPTVDYYDRHADDFVRDTLAVDVTPLHEPFLALLPVGGRVLDAGCGSGRDAREFKRRGFVVTAFDASPELAQRASGVVGQPVTVMRFQEVAFNERFDGVWACASLLHLHRKELGNAIRRLAASLVVGGVFFASFKCGDGEGERGGRYFTDFTAEGLREELSSCPLLEVLRIWESADARPERSAEKWVNALARKRNSEGEP